MKKMIRLFPIFVLMGFVITTSALAAYERDDVGVSAIVSAATPSIMVYNLEEGGIELATFDFETVPNSVSDHRTKQATPADGGWVDYFAGPGMHEIRVWFDNYPGVTEDGTKALAGLKATVGGTPYYWPLKVWCANLGPDDTGGPDPEIDSNWRGTPPTYADARYKWVFERAFKLDGFNPTIPDGYPSDVTHRIHTRTTLAWYYPTGTDVPTGTALDARLPSRFKVDLAIDAVDAQYAVTAATTYEGTLVFDLEQSP